MGGVVRFNTVILTKVKVQSINYVTLYGIESNKFRGSAIGLDYVYVCDDTRDEILETFFQGNNCIMMNLFWKYKLKLVMMRVNVTKVFFRII